MKVKHYNEMMAYLTRPGFNGGGSVRNKTVLPKRKPAAEVKRRQKINYEKIKQYLEDESQEFIERELGFAVGGRVNPAQLKQRFMQLVASIPDADDAEIPGIVAQAKQIKDQIDEINKSLSPERQIKIVSEGLEFDNPLLDAAKIAQTVGTTQEVTGGLTENIVKDVVPETLTRKNPIYEGVPDYNIRGALGVDEREKDDPKIDGRVGITPDRKFMQTSMKMEGRRTSKNLRDYLRNIDLAATEGSFAEGGRIGFDRGGMVKMLEYLETLPEDTTVTIPELMDVAKKKRIKVSPSSLSNMLTNIDGKQIAGSGNETYQFSKERRGRVKNILKNVTIEKAPTGTPSGTQMTVKRRNKANKIAKILYERGDISSPNYADIKFESKDYYKINARMNRKIIKKKDGTLDFKDESKKPLRSDQQAKLKKRFPEADFTKGKYGFLVDSAEEQYAKKYFKQGYKDSLRVGLTAKEIEDVKERFKKEIPKSEWNFLTKDNPKGFIYGLKGTGAGGEYEGMGNRIRGYLEGQPWFDKFAPGLNADRKNYLLTSFERVAEYEDKQIKKGNLKEKDRTYNRIKDKDGRIIGFKDNTPTGQGRKYFMTDMKLKVGNLSVTQHPQYAGTAKLAKYVEATKGLMIGGSKFNDLVNNVMNVNPSTFGIMPFERHHIYGTAKDNFGGKPGEIMLLTRDQNRAVENVRKAYFRLPTSKAGPPISFEEADKELKKIGAAIQLDGRLAGEIVSEEKTILQAAKLANIQKETLIKAIESLPKNLQFKICNSLKSGGLPGDCPKAIEKNPVQTLDTIEEEVKKFPKQTGDEVLKTVNKIRQGLKFTGAAFLTEVPFEAALALNPFKRGKPVDEIIDQSLFAFTRGNVPYGIGQDLNRPNIEEFVNTTQRAGALKFYDYYKDQNRLNEIDKTLRRLAADQPDADTSDLLQEKDLIQSRLGAKPTDQDAEDFSIFIRRRAGEFEANKKARGQYGPFTNIIQGTTPQSFSDAAEELNIDLGGMLGELVLPEREQYAPTTTRKQRRDKDFMEQRAEGIKQLEQDILYPATGSSFAGGGIAKLAGKSSGTPPTSGPNSGGLPSIRKNDMRIQE